MKLTPRPLVLGAIVVAALAAAPTVTSRSFVPTIPSAVAAASCTTTGYTLNCTGCVKISSTDAFTLKVPKASLKLTGHGTSNAFGTTLCVAKIAPPVAAKGGIGIRVTATGSFAAIKVAKGKVYSYNKKSGSLKKVKTIAKPGIYQVIG